MESLAALDAANVLIAAPASDEAARDACARLRSGGGAADRSLVGVTFTHTPDEWLAARAGQLPPKVWLVCVGEEARSAAVRRTGATHPHTDVTVRTVESPGNFTRLGVAVTECLPAAVPADDPRAASLCVESLETLYRHAESRSVYLFLQILADQVSAYGVTAHYHVDPAAIETRDLHRLELLFDAVVDVSAAGEVAVRTG